ncbi:MAG: hypothetical protein R3F37_17130 [Candidatus Competibacteraceae bacterium]
MTAALGFSGVAGAGLVDRGKEFDLRRCNADQGHGPTGVAVVVTLGLHLRQRLLAIVVVLDFELQQSEAALVFDNQINLACISRRFCRPMGV